MDIDVAARAQQAKEYFKAGYNCAQAVAMAFSDVAQMSENQVSALLSGFGGGFGRLREVCGCVSGMTFVAGCVLPAVDPSDMQRRKDNYALVQRLAASFKEEYGSIVCRDLLNMAKSSPVESPMPSERTAAYYGKRPCEEQVGKAAEIVAKELLNNF